MDEICAMPICRTCLRSCLPKNECSRLCDYVEKSDTFIKDMIEIFMPEMDLDISSDEVIICFTCREALENAYMFKNVCLKTEERIYDYLHRNNIKLGGKIDLVTIALSEIKHDANIKREKVVENCDNLIEATVSQAKDITTSDSIYPEKPTGSRKREKRKCKIDYGSLKRSYTCDQCEYKAYRLDLLKTHKLKHDKNLLGVKEYTCEYCPYSTYRKRALDRHLFTHKGNSRHSCDICFKTFAEKYQLKLHSITHTGQELPHKCLECGKGYLTKSYLKSHMDNKHYKKDGCTECPPDTWGQCEHSSNKHGRTIVISKCPLCEKCFADKRGLDAHMSMHAGGDLSYKCYHCEFSTAWKSSLIKHMRNKHGHSAQEDSPYKCLHCQFGTAWKSSLMKHVRNKHSADVAQSDSTVEENGS